MTTTWPGGNCPACDEFMPAASVHCRYCHAALVEIEKHAVEAKTQAAKAEHWQGGNCPACGEFMPVGSVRCRYCHAALVEIGAHPVEAKSQPAKVEQVPVLDPLALPASTESSHQSSSDALATTSKSELPSQSPRNPLLSESEAVKPSGLKTESEVRDPKHGDAHSSHRGSRTPSGISKGSHDRTQKTLASTSPPDGLPREQPHATVASPKTHMRESWTGEHGAWFVAAFLLAPLCVSGPIPGAGKPLSFGLPMVHSGDEPHHLVLIDSVIGDGDLDVKNNYADVHASGQQAGRKFAGLGLDHHVNWYWQHHVIRWGMVYEMDGAKWDKDRDGHPVPTLQKNSIHKPDTSHEYSSHSPGLAFLTAPFLVVFRGTRLVEPMALLLSSLATIGGMFAFCRLVTPYARASWLAVAVAALAYLGSPLWHYGRTLSAETFMAFFGVAAYAAALRENRYLLAGVFLGSGVLLGVPFMILALPLIGEAILRQKWGDVMNCAAPVLIAYGIVLFWNYRMHGEWLRFPDKWEWSLPLEGVIGLAFSWRNGLLLFAPAVLVAALAVPEWFRRQQRDAILMGTATLLYFALMASRNSWWGGAGYSARFLVPIMPFLFVPLAVLFDSDLWKQDWKIRWGAIMLLWVSVNFGAIGAFGCEHVWNKHPLELIL